ncbi:MAG: nucleotide-diphospho-sugar transferase [Bacteroidota bacterium]|nr:nucleotide-diphospho-sugar transferase [Bacteroidota bacterium]
MEENKIPILLLTFNRPEETFRVLEIIKKYQPKKLFIASDGYRNHVEGEDSLINGLREKMIKFVNWDCELQVLFSDKNLGCKLAVYNSINWFFKEIDFGVILEDDVIPKINFFSFCYEMSKIYKNDSRVFSISGYNPLPFLKLKESYYFSKYFFSWGWATWKHKWDKIDINFESYNRLSVQELKDLYPLIFEFKLRRKKNNDAINGKNSSWATPWNVTHQLFDSYSIIPKTNQIKNIGFSDYNSTHTKVNFIDKIFMDIKAKNLSLPIKHPKKIESKKTLTYYYILKELIRITIKKLTL